MDNRLVGDPGCEVTKIVGVLLNSPTASQLSSEWNNVALRFGTPIEDVNQFKQQQFLNMKGISEIWQELLFEWRSRMAEQATLSKLIDIFEETKMLQVANSLKKALQTPSLKDNYYCNHIIYYMPDLINLTKIDKKFLRKVQKVNILSRGDIAHLNTFDGGQEKSRRFYNLLILKVTEDEAVYAKFIELLDENYTQGDFANVSALLSEIYD